MKKVISACIASTCATSAFAVSAPWTSASYGDDHFYDFALLDHPLATSDAKAVAEASDFNGEIGNGVMITTTADPFILNAMWRNSPLAIWNDSPGGAETSQSPRRVPINI